MDLVQFIFLLILLAVFLGIVFYVLRNGLKAGVGLLINTIFGFIAIFLLNFLGIHIPINTITLLVCAIFGLLGVAMLSALTLFGMI